MLTDEEYKKLVNVSIKLRTLESMLAEALDEAKNTNEIIRELILKKTGS